MPVVTGALPNALRLSTGRPPLDGPAVPVPPRRESLRCFLSTHRGSGAPRFRNFRPPLASGTSVPSVWDNSSLVSA